MLGIKEPLITVEHVSFQYRRASEPALIDVSLELYPGEVLLVAGPSGCGKSTLLRCLNGLIPATYRGTLEGVVQIGGINSRTMSLAEIARVAGSVLQDPERQIVASHVFDEVAFGLENQGLPVDEIRRRTTHVLDDLALLPFAERDTFTLSGGEKQKLAIAGVLVMQPRILLLDEPLANLDPASAMESLALCRRLADAGHCVVIIEHRVEEVLAIAPERVVLMDQGRIVYNGPGDVVGEVADPRAVKLPAPVAIRRFAELQSNERPAAMIPAAIDGEPLVALHAVEFAYDERPVLQGVNLAVHRGDRIAVLGPNGSGKSTLVKHMIGLLRPQHGTITVAGRPAEKMSVAQLAKHVGYVFQSPSHMLFAPTIRDEMAFGPRNIGQSEAEIATNTAEALGLMGLDGMEERPPLTLSFGQQRRLCIASVIAMHGDVLLMDEPTAGQDYRSYMQFMDGIERIGSFGAHIFITHDLDLAISYANRVVLFADGQVVGDGPPHVVLSDVELLRRCRLRPTSLLEENIRLLPHTGAFKRLEDLASLAIR